MLFRKIQPRFIVSGIRAVVRGAAELDRLTLRLPGMARFGVQVIGVARKPIPEPSQGSRWVSQREWGHAPVASSVVG